MKLQRRKNAFRNIGFGFLNKMVTLLFPFLMRTILIKTLGTEYLGLSSLFTSILQVLSLSELGIGSAMVFELYEPIAKNDTEKICKLQNLYRVIYRIIGIVILLIGTILLPFLNNFIQGGYPEDINISSLIKRIKAENIKEVILAIKPTVEGETTALYIRKLLEGTNVIISKIAHGIPMGADIDYIDSLTLEIALSERSQIS